jgi:hypothetical protein
MEAECSSETVITTYEATRCHNTADHNPHLHYYESAKSHNILLVYICILGHYNPLKSGWVEEKIVDISQTGNIIVLFFSLPILSLSQRLLHKQLILNYIFGFRISSSLSIRAHSYVLYIESCAEHLP